MICRPFKSTDYSTVAGWWQAQKWPVVPASCLPETAFIVEDVCAGWLYKTDSKIAILEWVIANPESDKSVRATALDILISALTDSAKAQGFGHVLTMAKHPKLLGRYIEHGFLQTDEGMTHLIKGL